MTMRGAVMEQGEESCGAVLGRNRRHPAKTKFYGDLWGFIGIYGDSGKKDGHQIPINPYDSRNAFLKCPSFPAWKTHTKIHKTTHFIAFFGGDGGFAVFAWITDPNPVTTKESVR